LARLRDDYQAFTKRDAEILAVGPDGAAAFRAYWSEERLPFPGMTDPGHAVARRYRQEVNLLKLGRMPLIIVIDRKGVIRLAHRASSMSDIPSNEDLLKVIDDLDPAPP
jgi:peroxiredoxin Q/BCP